MTTAGEISGTKKRYYAEERHLREADDFYVEGPWVTVALLKAEKVTGKLVYDPAAGMGNVLRAARSTGNRAIGSDIEPSPGLLPERMPDWMRQQPVALPKGARRIRRIDFLRDRAARTLVRKADWVVCNPPYLLACEFAERALDAGARNLALLVQQKFLFSQGRHAFFTATPPSCCYILSKRPSMPPGHLLLAGKLEARGGKTDYVWLVWRQPLKPTTQLRWLLP